MRMARSDEKDGERDEIAVIKRQFRLHGRFVALILLQRHQFIIS